METSVQLHISAEHFTKDDIETLSNFKYNSEWRVFNWIIMFVKEVLKPPWVYAFRLCFIDISYRGLMVQLQAVAS